ncbi:hypothetical protein PGIGA_G00254930, partial [Pangasianodon gigas]|nr:hypothetical protein [Pangasianodon gigas]
MENEYCTTVRSSLPECFRGGFKILFRGKLIAQAAKKKRENLNRIKELEKEIKNRELQLINMFSDNQYQELCKLKYQLHEIYNKKVEYALYRLKTNFYEGGEKTGKLLARQLREKNTSNTIPVIKQGDRQIFVAKDINKTFQQYYEKLYTSTTHTKFVQNEIKDFLSNVDVFRLQPEQLEEMESPISLSEIKEVISSMKTGKSPGADGLPVEYYKEFVDVIAPILNKVYQEMFRKRRAPPTLNETLISLIPKKGRDLTEPSNFRPISLLNVDLKILTKILANRLQKVLPNIIHPNQVGFMNNRASSDHIRLLFHLIWTCQSRNTPITAISLDAEKAFDKVEWQFLFETLSHFGFGQNFISWVQILYKEPKAAVITNGVVSPFFNLSRGTRQGCSLSPLLFIIFLEILAIIIRAHSGIRGVKAGDKEHKLLLYADYILAVITDPLTSLPHLMDVIQSFSKLSGYTVNWNKSEATPLSNSCVSVMVEKFKFKWVPKGMKYLGIKLSRNMEEITALNLHPLLQKFKTNLEKWEKIKLTLWGKISIIKMVTAPQLNYVLMMLPIKIPNSFFKQFDSLMKHFLWDGKRARINLNKLIAPKEKGGLGFPDCRLYHLSFALAKIAKYWNQGKDKTDWMNVEYKICS